MQGRAEEGVGVYARGGGALAGVGLQQLPQQVAREGLGNPRQPLLEGGYVPRLRCRVPNVGCGVRGAECGVRGDVKWGWRFSSD